VDAQIAERLLEQAPDALVMTSAEGQVLFANTAVTTLFGYEPAELLNKSMDVLLPERFRHAHLGHRKHYASNPTQRAMGQRGTPLFGLRRDGSEFPIWVSLSPIHMNDQLLIAAAIRDVTDWQTLTEHLRAASEESQKASQTKSRFLATASHDLRQPLQALQLLTASLETALSPGSQRHLTNNEICAIANKQHHAIEAMTELLNALLDISKLESGTVDPKLEQVSAAQLVDEMHDQFDSIIAAKKLTFETGSAAIRIRTDRILIRQLVQNLVGNAIKYSDRGTISLKINHAAGEASIVVSDGGIGISRDQISKIFDVYYQPHAARPDRPGVGLGLAIVKQIAELLGYGIQVDSQPGRGTTFRIILPAALISDDLPCSSTPARLPPSDVPQGHCILIIEDDHSVREALALALELEGFIPLTAAGDAEAHAVFDKESHQISAVVSDYHVDTRHTGVDIVKALREKRSAPLPAVFLTGDTSLAIRSQRNLSDSLLLNKPVDVNQLVRALAELLKPATQAPAAKHSVFTT